MAFVFRENRSTDGRTGCNT